jgi:nicotinamidase-related amidase
MFVSSALESDVQHLLANDLWPRPAPAASRLQASAAVAHVCRCDSLRRVSYREGMTDAVLIVVDLLNDFFERSQVLAEQRGRLATATNALTRGVREAGLPVIWVRQELEGDLSDAPLDQRDRHLRMLMAGTSGCELLPELVCGPGDRVVIKKRYSAFFGTDLDRVLAALHPERLIVCGINTHACIRTTVIDAYQRDYRVIVATDAIGSTDTEHHDVTVRYLDGKMARFLSNAEIFALLRRDESASPMAPDGGPRLQQDPTAGSKASSP